MTEETIKLNNIRVNKKKINISKNPIDLILINIDQTDVSYKFDYNEASFKYFFGYQKGEIVKPLCITLPQTNGYKIYFEYGGQNMSFFIKDNTVLNKI